MRLRERDMTTVYLKARIITRDEEGDKTISYSSNAEPLRMNVQSAGGVVNAQIYGGRLPYIKTCKYQGDGLMPGKNEKDGICLYVDSASEPDYEILSIEPFSEHLNVKLEKLIKET